MAAYTAFWTFIFGLVFGSFLNCAAMRIVRHEDFIHGKSHCTSCGHELLAKDLIPLVSWIAAKGRCRYCGKRLSARYPLTELMFAILLVGLFLRYGLSLSFAARALFTASLFVLALVDLESFEIPDGCLVVALLDFGLTAPAFYSIKEIWLHVAAGVVLGGGMLVLSLVMDHILQKESLGGGDIKLFALLGLWFGFVESLLLLFLSCVIGLAFAYVYQRKKGRGSAFPFGPAIAAAAYGMFLF